MLLTRDKFRESIFERDNYRCVNCGSEAKDAHHIIERRLWSDGGYYLDNGVSLCSECHVNAETTLLSCDELRSKAGITKIYIPENFYDDYDYDKWGNIILNSGSRIKGPLFHDESVQKILKDVLYQFRDQVKYPRTYHLPYSKGFTKDDRVLKNDDNFIGKKVVITEKMDGENTSMYYDYIHARSIDSESHPSQSWVRNFWNEHVRFQINKGWRICGENLFAKHQIPYNELQSYFMGFSIWNNINECLSWDETLEYFDLLGIVPVPVLYYGIYSHNILPIIDEGVQEGFVVRLADKFLYGEFSKSIAKYVRENHCKDVVHHWKAQQIVPNKLRS